MLSSVMANRWMITLSVSLICETTSSGNLCHICQKKFSKNGNLKVHLLRHGGVKLYVCSECPKHFCTGSELRSHQLVHSDVKHFCCGSCGTYFRHKHYSVKHFTRRFHWHCIAARVLVDAAILPGTNEMCSHHQKGRWHCFPWQHRSAFDIDCICLLFA